MCVGLQRQLQQQCRASNWVIKHIDAGCLA
jgi:hypothetical protein